MAEAQTTPGEADPEAAAAAAKAAEEAARDPKNWSPEKRQGESYIPPKAEYVDHGYKAEDYDAFVEERTKAIKALGLTPHSNRMIRPEGKHYLITPALPVTHKQLNMVQRRSSFFSEAPRVMGKPMRRGAKLLLSESEMKMNELQIMRLHKNHAIEIHVVDGDKKVNLRDLQQDALEKAKPEKPSMTKKEEGSAPLKPEEVTGETLDATIKVAISPPAEALPGGPDPTVFPVNPAAAASDSELEAATEVTGADEGATVADSSSPKKKGKKAKKEE